MLLDSFHFRIQGLHKRPLRRFSIDVPQERPYIRVQRLAVSLTVQEYLRRLVAQLQPVLFHAPVSKRIHRQAFVKGIEGANKYDIRRPELIVYLALFQHIHIDHGLIVARPLRQSAGLVVAALHFNIEYPPRIVLDIYVQAHAFAVQPDVDSLLRIGISNVGNLNLQYFLN